jgi:hypothetical protein
MSTSTPVMPAAATVALWMATQLGWYVLPLHPGTKRPLGGCSGCRGGRHTAVDCACLARRDGALCHGVWAASNNPDIVTRWGHHRPSGVWGLHVGASGLLCVDLDTHPATVPAQPLNTLPWPSGAPAPADGLDTFATLAGLHDAGIDTTLSTETPSGGLHLIYTAEPGRWKSSTAVIRDGRVTCGVGWQIDIKCYAGYVVIPASTTTTGVYRRVSPTVIPDALPAWLAGFLARTGHDRHTTPTPTATPLRIPTASVLANGDRAQRFTDGALRSACVELSAMAPNSGRNRKLFRSASRLAGMAAAGWIDRARVETALTDAAQLAGLPAGEIRYAIASGFRTPRPAPQLRSVA